MNGGPVGPIDGDYVNGDSTPGSGSPVSTPRKIHFKSSEEAIPHPHVSPRAGTWPRSPSLPTDVGLEDQEHPVSHPIPSLGLHEGEAGGRRSRGYGRVRTYSDDDGDSEHGFPRISRPVELLRRSYDCVVIGSGYGGAVAASRMARTGESVCVLERGKEKWPGEYPNGAEGAVGELHWTGTFEPNPHLNGLPVDGGDSTGMYHMIFGKGQNAVVCNGESSGHCSLSSGKQPTDIADRSWWDEPYECQRIHGGKP